MARALVASVVVVVVAVAVALTSASAASTASDMVYAAQCVCSCELLYFKTACGDPCVTTNRFAQRGGLLLAAWRRLR